MKQKPLLLLGIALLLAAVGIYLYSGKKNAPANPSISADANQSAQTDASSQADAAGNKTSRTQQNSDAVIAQLTERYGDSRTKLSKSIAFDIAGLMKEAMELADMGAALAGSTSAKEQAIKGTLDALANRLKLTDEQKEQARGIVEQRVERRIASAKEMAASLEKDPTSMMATILAGDAHKRGEISEAEYKAVASETLASMRQVSGFALSGRGGNDLGDAVLAEQLAPILDTEQKTQLDGIVQKSADAAPSPQQMPLQNGNFPAMEIESLDKAVVNAKKLTGGLKSLMEGMQGMKDLAPPQE